LRLLLHSYNQWLKWNIIKGGNGTIRFELLHVRLPSRQHCKSLRWEKRLKP